MTSKCSKLKWNHELRVSGLTAKFWTFHSFVRTLIFPLKFFFKNCTALLGEKQIVPSSGHFYCQLLLSNLALDQSVHENALSLWLNVIYFHFTLYTACFWFCELSVSYTAWWSPCNIPVSACLLWYIYFCTCYWNRSLGNQWKTFLHQVSLLLCFYWTSCLIYIVVQGLS